MGCGGRPDRVGRYGRPGCPRPAVLGPPRLSLRVAARGARWEKWGPGREAGPAPQKEEPCSLSSGAWAAGAPALGHHPGAGETSPRDRCAWCCGLKVPRPPPTVIY